MSSYFKRERLESATLSYRRRNDTINLLTKYSEICERLVDRISNGVEGACIVKASTSWVNKDVSQWFALCPGRTFNDSRKVWGLVRRLLHMGVIASDFDGTKFDVLRWRFYLMIGFGRLLLVNRLNLLGQQKKLQV